MKNKVRFLSVICVLVGTAGIARAANDPTEEVTVFAPYVVKKTVTRAPRSLPVTTINMSRGISYHGLDLTSDTDVATLEARVTQAAADVCKELDRRYSGASVDDDKNCAKNAADNALAEVRTVVAAVRSTPEAANKSPANP